MHRHSQNKMVEIKSLHQVLEGQSFSKSHLEAQEVATLKGSILVEVSQALLSKFAIQINLLIRNMGLDQRSLGKEHF